MFAEDKLLRYPLRQSLLPTAENVALCERQGIVDHLSRPDSFLVICEGQEGRVYAANERASKEAQEIIAAAYGDAVIAGEPEVHTYLEPALDAMVEPVMFLRVKVPRGYAASIVEDLERRAVRILQRDFRRVYGVVRAEVRLADLLGYEDAVQTLTNGSAVVWNWLLRYETARPSPNPSVNPSRDEQSESATQRSGERERQTSLLPALLRNAAS